MGALLDHLARARAVGELDDEGLEGLEVRGIEVLTLWVSIILMRRSTNSVA